MHRPQDGSAWSYTWEAAQAAAACWWRDYDRAHKNWQWWTECAAEVLARVVATLRAPAPRPVPQQQRPGASRGSVPARTRPENPIEKLRRAERQITRTPEQERRLRAAIAVVTDYLPEVNEGVARTALEAAAPFFRGVLGQGGYFSQGAASALARVLFGADEYAENYRERTTRDRKVSQILRSIEG